MTRTAILEHVLETPANSFLFRFDTFLPDTEDIYHFHPEYELQYVETGSGHRLIGGVLEPFSEGVVQLIPGDVPHNWYYSWEGKDEIIPAGAYCIQFKKDVLTKVLSLIPELRGNAEFILNLNEAIEINGDAAERIGSIFRSMKKQDGFDRFISFLRLLKETVEANEIRHIKIDCILSDSTRRKNRIQTALAYMDRNLDRNLSIGEVAGTVNMNKNSFCTYFKKATGKTFSRILNDLRISKATLLLCNRGSMSISEIAYSVGYDSISHFNHTFVKLKGETPSAYREKHYLAK